MNIFNVYTTFNIMWKMLLFKNANVLILQKEADIFKHERTQKKFSSDSEVFNVNIDIN